MIFIAIIASTIFLCPTSSSILLPQNMIVFLPFLRNPACFDFFIFWPSIALSWHRNKRGINDLTGLNSVSPFSQVIIEA